MDTELNPETPLNAYDSEKDVNVFDEEINISLKHSKDLDSQMQPLAKSETSRDVFHGYDLSETTEDNRSTSSERETWSRSIDFILSLLGYAVGLGNLWRFPYLCVKNGGGAFLFPFLICLVTCGLPLFFLEVSLGQFIGKSCIKSWAVCPLFKGIGIGMVVLSSVCSLYYNIIVAWTLYYIVNSFRPNIPWTTCSGWWNTKHCFVQTDVFKNIEQTGTSTYSNSTSMDPLLVKNVTYEMHNKTSSEEEFWQYNTLQITSGLGDFGSMPWHLVVSFLCAWIIVFLCIMRGVRSIGKVVYVTAVLPYILLIVLLIRGLTLEGASIGVLYYLTPDLQKMMTVQVWVEAALQVFYSLGCGWGALISMASFNKFNNNCLRDSLIVCFVGEGTSVFSGLVVFTILGFVSHELNVPIDEVVKSGPGLGFIAYPQALARLPIPNMWSVLFFVMLLTIGLDSQFGMVESIVAGIVDMFPRLQKRRLIVSMMVCSVFFVIGLPMCLQGGIYIFQLLDWYIAIIGIPVFGLLECIIFGWVYGAERFSRDIELMLGRGVPIFMRVCWCFITPTAITLCMIFSLITYVPASYGDYHYPAYAQGIGWLVGTLPVIPVVLVAIKQLFWNTDKPLKEAFLLNMRPSNDWKPHAPEYSKTYSLNAYSYNNVSFLQRIKINILGDNSNRTDMH